MSSISILVDENDSQYSKPEESKPHTTRSNKKLKVEDIATSKLQASMKSLCDDMSIVLKDAKQVGGFQLKEVSLQVQVSAEGSFVLIGKAGIKGAITLKFAPE